MKRILVAMIIAIVLAGGLTYSQFEQPPCMYTVLMVEASVNYDRSMWVTHANPTGRVQLIDMQLITPQGSSPVWHDEVPAHTRRSYQLFPDRIYSSPQFLSLTARWPTFGMTTFATFEQSDMNFLHGQHSPQQALLTCRSSNGVERLPIGKEVQ